MTDQQATYNVDALNRDAAQWVTQGNALKKISELAKGLRLSRLAAGAYYQPLVDPYNTLTLRVGTLSAEGEKVMLGIGEILRGVADDAKAADEEAARQINAARQRKE